MNKNREKSTDLEQTIKESGKSKRGTENPNHRSHLSCPDRMKRGADKRSWLSSSKNLNLDIRNIYWQMNLLEQSSMWFWRGMEMRQANRWEICERRNVDEEEEEEEAEDEEEAKCCAMNENTEEIRVIKEALLDSSKLLNGKGLFL